VSTELNWPADKKNRDREDAEKIETLDRALGLHDG
jgi:hypothetical protein